MCVECDHVDMVQYLPSGVGQVLNMPSSMGMGYGHLEACPWGPHDAPPPLLGEGEGPPPDV